jgi:hypothetical protein
MLENGMLIVTGTNGDDVIKVGSDDDATMIYVAMRGVQVKFAAADVRGIRVNAGSGNDEVTVLNHSVLLDVQVTMVGGAGDDWLEGQGDRDWMDRLLTSPDDGPYPGTTLIGGGGDDYLGGGLGHSRLVGGGGTDTFAYWGSADIVDDQLSTPPALAPSPIPDEDPDVIPAVADGTEQASEGPSLMDRPTAPPVTSVAVFHAGVGGTGIFSAGQNSDVWE